MNAHFRATRLSRRTVLKGGALTVGFALAGVPVKAMAQGAAARVLDTKELDAFLAINADGTVTLWTGKVDLGQGLRIALPQMAAEELGIGIDKIRHIEGDTALTPDQGRTSGSNGIQRGGVQIRQAAATARKALIELAAKRLNAKPEDLVAIGGEVRPKAGGKASVLPISSAGSALISSSIPRRRSRIPRAIRWSANRCRARTSRTK
jgi:CO/xanthine dehydrogenase Mo-binding subunit